MIAASKDSYYDHNLILQHYVSLSIFFPLMQLPLLLKQGRARFLAILACPSRVAPGNGMRQALLY